MRPSRSSVRSSQAGTHRIADEQRSGQDGRGDENPEQHRQIHPPVVPQAA